MPYDPADVLNRLPPLRPGAAISRPVSGPEYYHASVGTSAATLEHERRVVFIVSGRVDGSLGEDDWRRAVAAVAQANPVLRMRWRGRLGWSRWTSDGPLPALRLIAHTDWDINSSDGFEFIVPEPLSLRDGPVTEFIVAGQGGGRALVILRSLHAIVDGKGGLHALEELFRALRGEPLLGSNAAFSDADLMRALALPPGAPMHEPTCRLCGEPEGDDPGDDWQRLSLGPVRPQLLGRIAAALAACAHRYSDLPALIAVPVDMRRHAPGLCSVANFSSMVLVRMLPGDGPEVFQERLRALLDQHREAAFGSFFDWLHWFPLRLLDRLLGRTRANFRQRAPLETVVISNLGRIDLSRYSAPGFSADDMGLMPQPGNAFVVLFSIDGDVRLTLNLPRHQAGGGRREAVIAALHEAMRA